MSETEGPEGTARAWVEAIMDRRDLGAAWALTDPPLRLVLAQHWILSRLHDPAVTAVDRDELAEALAACPSTHPLWERFASERIRRWRQHWGQFSARTWDVAGDPEPMGDDLRVVTFLERHRLTGWARPGPPPPARRLAVRHRPEGWLVAGLDGSALFRPGWPPTQLPPRQVR